MNAPPMDGVAKLEQRLRRLRSRLAVRDWELRQQSTSKGCWARLGRVLCDASEVYGAPLELESHLTAAGLRSHEVGLEFEPPQRIYFISQGMLEGLREMTGLQPLPVRLTTELLQAPLLLLVPFPSK